MIIIEEYFISIDGGGSKTEVCIFEYKSKKMKILKYDCININQIGEIVFANRLHKIFEQLPLAKNYQIYAGIPGYGEASETDRYINELFRKFIPDQKYTIINDVELAHYASFGLKDGILILSGTGSMALAINNQEITRSGGWGYLIGDEGSAFQIGLSAVNHLSHVFDGIEKSSILSKILCEKYKFDFSSKLVSFVYKSKNYRKEIAFMSKLVDVAAEKGCEVAINILDNASKHLIKMIQVLNEGEGNKISYAGSVFNSKILKELVEKNGGFKFTTPMLQPVLGGILKLECDYKNIDINQEIDQLLTNYEKIIEEQNEYK